MHWFPQIGDFRAELAAAAAEDDDAAKFRRLAELSRHNLDFVQTMQLDRVLDGIAPAVVDRNRRCRIAVLSSITADQLLPGIRVACLRRNILAHTCLPPYGQYRQQLLDRGSALHKFEPQVVLLSFPAREAIAGIPLASSAEAAEERISRFLDDLAGVWSGIRKSLRAGIVQQTFMNVANPLFGSFDRAVPGAPGRVIRRLNERLVEAASANDVSILDMDEAIARRGLDYWFDVTRWLQGKIEISPEAAPLYGELVARIIGAQRGLSSKCLVLDLDNTLWGGVIGDDGVENIVLGEGSATGEAFLAFQHYVRQLAERGVILAVCSKNDETIAESAFREHPEMVLQRADFAAFCANWDDKAANLPRIAEQLNIGIDSLVFADDNPAERERVRRSLPMVAVPELPADPANYARCLSEAGYFEAVVFSEDDLRRREQYAANESRAELESSSESLDDYLENLQMTARAGPFEPVDLQRICQLINKTNQFNTTTRRRDMDEVREIAADPACITLQLRLSDRFGDNGLVSVLILRPVAGRPDTLDVDTWLMSCRVIGRQLEHETLNVLVALAKKRNAKLITASYRPTERNGLIRDLYASLGFEAIPAEGEAEPGETRWRLSVDDYAGHETPIRLVENRYEPVS